MSKLALGLLVFVLAAFVENGVQARCDWLMQQDPQFGFTYSYPAELFARTEGERPSFYYFRSQQSDAKFMVGAWNNEKGSTPEVFKHWMLNHAAGYEDITYQPHGRPWGHRGDQIYYEKTIFSCSGRVVNIFAIAYPEAERQRFDPIVERMEDDFKGGRGCG